MPYGGWGTLGDLGMAAYQPRRQMMGPAQSRQPGYQAPRHWGQGWDIGIQGPPPGMGPHPGGPLAPRPGSADMPGPGGGGIGGFPPGGMMPQPGPYGQGQQPGVLPSPWAWPQSKLMGR